jgi:hypothetical protein
MKEKFEIVLKRLRIFIRVYMMRFLRIFVIPFVILALLLGIFLKPGGTVYSQTGWNRAINLCNQKKCWFPQMTSDMDGKVHAIWGGWQGKGDPGGQSVNTIYYSQFDGNYWTTPADILVAPAESGGISTGEIIASKDGGLYIPWMSGGYLYVSYAPIESASDARFWKSTRIDVGRGISIAADDENGLIYVLYVGTKRNLADDAYIYTINFTSIDENLTAFSEPFTVWELPNEDGILALGNMIVDQNQNIHATWTESTVLDEWLGKAIWYASISPDSGSVGDVQLISEKQNPKDPNRAFPYIIECSNRMMLLFWSNGVGSTVGRYFTVSSNDGRTWGKVQNIFAGELSGLTGNPGMVCSGDDRVEVVTAAYNGQDYNTGVRYSTYKFPFNIWQNYQSIEIRDHPGEHPAITITNGNTLHLIWNDYKNAAIMYTSQKLDTPYTKPVGIIKKTPTQTPVATRTLVISATPTPIREIINKDLAPKTNPNIIFLISLLPVGLLLIVAVAIVKIKTR